MKHSIFLKITLFFLITFIGMGIGFYALELNLREEYEEKLLNEASSMLFLLRKSVVSPLPVRKSFLERFGYHLYEAPSSTSSELRKVFATPPESFPPEIRESMEEGRIEILKDDTNLYIRLPYATPPLVLEKTGGAYRPIWPEMLFGAILSGVLILYLLLIKTLSPLALLKRTIHRYGEEGRYTPIERTGKDEIGLVADALNLAMHKNQSLLEARRLFLRNIMHELKTPITVGKLSLPFIKDGEEKAILERAFTRMETLIRELSRVEQITSGALSLNLRECYPKELAEQACKLLFIPSDKVETRFEGNTIYADCELMIIVFKNLIDNGLKYSSDHTMRITQSENRNITFSNRADPWKEGENLESMCEPFFHHAQETQSFGLGLYIVKSVIEAHGFTLLHRYEEGEHHFILECQTPLEGHG